MRPLPAKPKVILIVGVNGTGKTTSTAKLAHYFKKNRHSVLLAAADTFRAAAIEQLGIWAERLGVEMIRGQYNADPAALCYEAYQSADKPQHRVSDLRHGRPAAHEKQSDGGAEQSETQPRQTRCESAAGNFARRRCDDRQQRALPGARVSSSDRPDRFDRDEARWQRQRRIVIAIQDELGIPTRFVGTGEKLEDFALFDGREFIANMV